MYWGLRAQNHRGHQSHGFLTFDTKFHVYKSLDLVPSLKNEAIHEWFDRLPGSVGIGNVRYTTSGKCDDTSIIEGTQPVYASSGNIKLALSFNGNIVNTLPLKKEMTENFSDFYFNCDSDVVCHKLLLGLKQGKDLASAVRAVMESLDGAFSVTGLTGDGEFFAFKDPHGIKPLVAGHDPQTATVAFCSETVGLDMNGFVRDFELKPGELVTVSKDGFKRTQIIQNPRASLLLF